MVEGHSCLVLLWVTGVLRNVAESCDLDCSGGGGWDRHCWPDCPLPDLVGPLLLLLRILLLLLLGPSRLRKQNDCTFVEAMKRLHSPVLHIKGVCLQEQ